MNSPSIRRFLMLLQIQKDSTNRTAIMFWSVFVFFFSSQYVPPCLSRKPKRAESEIPSLPEAGPAVLSFERQHGKINGHLLREPPGHTVLLPHGQTALGPVVCCSCCCLCCCCCCWVSMYCLLWEDFQPCAAIKISVFSLHLPFPLHPALSWTAFPPTLWQTSFTSPLHHFADNNCKLGVRITLCERGCWCDPQLCEHLSRQERREDFCAVVFIFPPSQHHGYQSDSAKVGPPHKFRNL